MLPIETLSRLSILTAPMLDNKGKGAAFLDLAKAGHGYDAVDAIMASAACPAIVAHAVLLAWRRGDTDGALSVLEACEEFEDCHV